MKNNIIKPPVLNKAIIALFISLFAIINNLQSQDIIFSQFYSAPLVLNPALTGFSSGDAQFVMNYRNNQRGLIPYNTMAFSGDMKLAQPIFKPDIVAAGIMVASDQFNGGQMGSLNILASGAYHWQINKSNFLSGGIQLGLFQRSVDPNSFSYGDQYDPLTGYNPTLDNNESFSSEKSYNFDFNLGLFYYSSI
jgi:type IX secretion system PorP/SprF family membrane protein